MRKRSVPINQRHSVYPGARSAVHILAEILSMGEREARVALRQLVERGFIIAPLEPTNAMLDAYMTALGSRPASTRHVIMTNIGKARKRWRAMATAETSTALSLLVSPDQSEKDHLPALILEENGKL